MTPAYAVLFKCHYWDDFTQRQLERLKQRCATGDIFILFDETAGHCPPIDHPPARILPISRTTAESIGLYHTGKTPVFWYSNDYPLHIFTRRHPRYHYYLMIEFDVVVTIDLDPLIARLHEAQVDFVGEPIHTPLPQWPWLASCEGWYPPEQVLHWLTCLAIFSNRAAHHLFQRRIAAANDVRTGRIAALPMCEAVIPTELNLAGFRLMALSHLGSTTCYDSMPPRPEGILPTLTNQAFIHPVLDATRFAEKAVGDMPDPARLLEDDHPLRQRIGDAAVLFALPLVHHSLYVTGDDAGCRRVIAQMRRSTDPAFLRLHSLDGANLALGKPATQSSLSEWSLRPDEANGAVSGPVSGRHTFHTASEQNPWWTVDLLSPLPVGAVRVFNRMDIAVRAFGLEVYVSADGQTWDLAGRHDPETRFGGADGHPFDAIVGRTTRFVRLQLPRAGFLHLDQVQVLPPPADHPHPAS